MAEYKINLAENHNPDYDIVEKKLPDGTTVTYCCELATGKESMEYYRGKNFTISSENSYSRHWELNKIPAKYLGDFQDMKNWYLANNIRGIK